MKVSSHVKWRALPESISKPTQHCAVEARERRACNVLVAADIDDAEAVTRSHLSSNTSDLRHTCEFTVRTTKSIVHRKSDGVVQGYNGSCHIVD